MLYSRPSDKELKRTKKKEKKERIFIYLFLSITRKPSTPFSVAEIRDVVFGGRRQGKGQALCYAIHTWFAFVETQIFNNMKFFCRRSLFNI